MRSARALGPLLALLLAGCGGGGGGKTTIATPAITTQPTAQTVQVGESATFSVRATGGSLSYQWTKDGVAIDGATSRTYTLASAALTDAVSYSVVVTNSAGTVTSDGGALTVANTGDGTVTVD